MQGWFTVDQAERYDAAIEGRLDLYGPGGHLLGHAAAQATRYRTIAEDASLNDRQRLWYALVEATAQDFATVMENAIRRGLGGYARCRRRRHRREYWPDRNRGELGKSM